MNSGGNAIKRNRTIALHCQGGMGRTCVCTVRLTWAMFNMTPILLWCVHLMLSHCYSFAQHVGKIEQHPALLPRQQETKIMSAPRVEDRCDGRPEFGVQWFEWIFSPWRLGSPEWRVLGHIHMSSGRTKARMKPVVYQFSALLPHGTDIMIFSIHHTGGSKGEHRASVLVCSGTLYPLV